MIRFSLIIVFCISGFYGLYAQQELASISSTIRKQLLQSSDISQLDSEVAMYTLSLQTDGRWLNIDYFNKEITKWKPLQHLERIKSFSKAYVLTNSRYHYDEALRKAIILGLQCWYHFNPKSKNWWQNEIATPQLIGEILILLQNSPIQFSENLLNDIIARMKQGDVFKQKGANKLDIAIQMIYRACITNNEALMDTAIQQAFQPISFTEEEGLQYDYSYLQHGPQLQISSYGLVFLTGEYKVASWVKGTSYALKGGQLRILGNYFVNTFLPTIRGKYIDFNTEGRGVSRKDILDKSILSAFGKTTDLLEIAKFVDPENADSFEAAWMRISQQSPPDHMVYNAHRYYWKADYTRHTRGSFNFNVRTVSTRTRRTETGNKENLLGKYLPDGSTNIQRSGKEYFNIMPVWEWDKIPGITSRDYIEDRPTIVQWGEIGSLTFVGGVSDSVYGATCYDMNYDSVKAKKSWFFFDHEVVCLGAGISSSSEDHIVTTLNQCWMNEQSKVLVDSNELLSHQNYTFNYANRIWHDSIGYILIQSAPTLLHLNNQKGSWSRINESLSNHPLEGDVFKLWIDHGKKPEHASYAYIVLPGINLENEMNYKESDIEIISNTPDQQVVYNKKLDMLQAVLYVKGKLKLKERMWEVDAPCVLLIKNASSNHPVMYVADPTQKLQQLNVLFQINESFPPALTKVTLPQNVYAGSSCRVN